MPEVIDMAKDACECAVLKYGDNLTDIEKKDCYIAVLHSLISSKVKINDVFAYSYSVAKNQIESMQKTVDTGYCFADIQNKQGVF